MFLLVPAHPGSQGCKTIVVVVIQMAMVLHAKEHFS